MHHRQHSPRADSRTSRKRRCIRELRLLRAQARAHALERALALVERRGLARAALKIQTLQQPLVRLALVLARILERGGGLLFRLHGGRACAVGRPMHLRLIVNAVRMLLPSPLQGMMQWTGERLQDWLGNALPATRSSVVVQEMEGWKAILLFVVLLLLMVCMLLPYILGAITFARIVMAEFHQIQEEREQQQREFDRKRNLMLSDIAHDLRTPVTTVSGYAKALADHMVQEPEKQQEYLNAIQNKSVRIGNLINLLFEYVKLDSEGFALNGKTLDLCELLRENAAMLYAEMEENGMTLTADIPEETIPVWADELQLSRVVTNLLTNAMQHNPKGTRIGLFAYRELERIYVLVADSGILIPEEQAQHLFDPFTRGDKARVSDGRNGLGLSIVSKIVQMHGWDLKLVQQPQIQHYAKAAGFAKAFVILMENAGMYSVHSPK